MGNNKRIGDMIKWIWNIIWVCVVGLIIFYASLLIIVTIIYFATHNVDLVNTIGPMGYILGVILAYLFIRHFSNQWCMLLFSIIYTLTNGRSALFYLDTTMKIVCCVISIVLVWIFWIIEVKRSREK